MITCKVGENIINCYDGLHNKEQLKKWASKNILICPVCDKPYEYCHGEFKSPYFRHKDKSECDDIYSEPESEEHINGKRDLFEWIKTQNGVSDVILEGWLPLTKQRPDIMFKYSEKQFVIEYQCTPISSEYVDRHELYQTSGIKDIWILGTDKYIEKSENNKSFRQKEIERQTNYYYDSEYKIFVFNSLYEDLVNYRTLQYDYCSNTYYYKQKRNLLQTDLLTNVNNLYMISMEYLEFKNSMIVINNNAKEALVKNNMIEKHNSLLEKYGDKLKVKNNTDIRVHSEIFLNKVFKEFESKYDIKLEKMSINNGFKFSKHYYRLINTSDPSIVSFCKINYIKNIPFSEKLFDLNVRNNNDVELLIKFLENDLKKEIASNKEYKEMIDNYKKQKNENYEKVKSDLSQYTKEPIYLIFKEDKIELPNDIRFKFIANYYDDEITNGLQLLEIFNFLKKKHAKYYTFMIPIKRLRTSSSMSYSYYKVNNRRTSVIDDFIKFGFKVKGYEDLLKEIKIHN